MTPVVTGDPQPVTGTAQEFGRFPQSPPRCGQESAPPFIAGQAPASGSSPGPARKTKDSSCYFTHHMRPKCCLAAIVHSSRTRRAGAGSPCREDQVVAVAGRPTGYMAGRDVEFTAQPSLGLPEAMHEPAGAVPPDERSSLLRCEDERPLPDQAGHVPWGAAARRELDERPLGRGRLIGVRDDSRSTAGLWPGDRQALRCTSGPEAPCAYPECEVPRVVGVRWGRRVLHAAIIRIGRRLGP